MKYGLEFTGERRVKRTWGGLVLCLVVLFLLSMLTGWLVSCVRHAAGIECSVLSAPCFVSESPSLPASKSLMLAGVNDWVAVGIVGLLVMGVLGRLAYETVLAARRCPSDFTEGEDCEIEAAYPATDADLMHEINVCRSELRGIYMLMEVGERDRASQRLTSLAARVECLAKMMGGVL